MILLFAGVVLTPTPADASSNPHWRKDACRSCHASNAPVAGNIGLDAIDAETLCEGCHGDGNAGAACSHYSDLEAGVVRVPDNLRAAMKNDKVVCTTCHDPVYQCEHPSAPYSFMNPGFLRDRASPKTGEYCFACHDREGYEKLNPHGATAGDPPRPTCLLCHDGTPGAGASATLRVGFDRQGDLGDMCRGCHVVTPHPDNPFASDRTRRWGHLVVPSDAIRSNMLKTETETGVDLPLNPLNGEIYCATCHSPHDAGVGVEQGSTEKRLRMDDICQGCHDK